MTRSLGTPDYLRVRFGIGRPPGRQDPAVDVLRDFSAAERKDLDVDLDRAADATEALVTGTLELPRTPSTASPVMRLGKLPCPTTAGGRRLGGNPRSRLAAGFLCSASAVLYVVPKGPAPMPLTGLLDLVRQDVVLDQAVLSAGAVPSLEVVAPQALACRSLPRCSQPTDRQARGVRCSSSPPPGARPRTPSTPCAASSTPIRSPTSRPGKPFPTNGFRRVRTRSAVGWPCCGAWRTRTPRTRRPVSSGSSSPRSARSSSPWSPVSGTSSRSACVRATRRR